MGKLEKLIVLTVLFAAVIVLAVSLSRGKDEQEASNPLSGARNLLDADLEGEDPVLPSTPISTPMKSEDDDALSPEQLPPDEPAPSLLLHAGSETPPAGATRVEPNAGLTPALRVEPASDPSSPILLDRQGLRPSFMDEYMLYTVAEGDTWSSLAQRFYQDGRFTRNLHLANEDLSELVPGKNILVPVFDLLAIDSAEEVAVGLEQPSSSQSGAPSAAGINDPPSLPVAATGDARPVSAGAPLDQVVYEVRSGDTLSDLALAALGTSTRWKELLELNRDVLAKPEDLRVGMKLKLPAGATIPAAVQSKPGQAKPKTAQAPKGSAPAASSSAKKRKVL